MVHQLRCRGIQNLTNSAAVVRSPVCETQMWPTGFMVPFPGSAAYSRVFAATVINRWDDASTGSGPRQVMRTRVSHSRANRVFGGWCNTGMDWDVLDAHRVRLCQALPDVLREPGAEGSRDRPAFEVCFELRYRGDAQLLIDTHYAFWIEARMGTEVGQGRRSLPTKLIELAERAGQHNFTDRACDAFGRSRQSGSGRLPPGPSHRNFRRRYGCAPRRADTSSPYTGFFLLRSSCTRLASRSAISALLNGCGCPSGLVSAPASIGAPALARLESAARLLCRTDPWQAGPPLVRDVLSA